jgi:hypothetical protein
MRSIHLDDIEGPRWKPIRSTLGIRAFGINAYVADAGEELFAEHDETEAGAGRQRHEELYVVLAGRAIFTVGGRDLDAPAGTLVFLDDAAERRRADAVAAQTMVLAIGGPVGEGYEVAPWEYWFRARAARERGLEADAAAIVAEGLASYPNDPTLENLRTELDAGLG